MSWKSGSASPEEHPLHYLDRRMVKDCIEPEHVGKLIKRLDPQLAEAIILGDPKLGDNAIDQMSRMKVHVWSSGTFTVVFMESGHMGCSKRNAVDDSEVKRGITIATARAISAMLVEQRTEYEGMECGVAPNINLDQIIPLPRRCGKGAEEKAAILVMMGEDLMAEMKADNKRDTEEKYGASTLSETLMAEMREDNRRASEALDRRVERNIDAHDVSRSGRFRY